MCGRFSLSTPAEEIAKFFSLVAVPRLKPRYNIAPTQQCAVVRFDPAAGVRRLTELHWGLIPFWAKDPSIGNRMINARSETIAEKNAFRSAFRKRRCLVPADGFYEWMKKGDRKLPYFIHRPRRAPFAFAGLWESWQGEEEREIESFTIITTDANEKLADLHDRMPVILDSEQFDAWLDPGNEDSEALQAMLDPAPDDLLVFHPVSTRVNSPKNEDPSVIDPVENAESLFEE